MLKFIKCRDVKSPGRANAFDAVRLFIHGL